MQYSQPVYQQACRTVVLPSPTVAATKVAVYAAPAYATPAARPVAAPPSYRAAPAAPVYSAAPGAIYTASPPVVRQAVPATMQVIRSVVPPVRIPPASLQARPNTMSGPTLTQAAYKVKHQDDPQLRNLKDLRETSGLRKIPVVNGLQAMKGCAGENRLTREQFLSGYMELLASHQIELPTEQVGNAVFDLFDRDDNNVVDMMELICGISLLCKGSEDEKIQAIFNIFDENGDGFISMDEMFKFLTAVFKVVLAPQVICVMNSMGVAVESAEDLASVTSLECFKTADLNHDGKLSVEEFKTWFYAPRNDLSGLFGSPVKAMLQ